MTAQPTMRKRSLGSPAPIGSPRSKVPKPDSPADDTSDTPTPTRTRDRHRDSTERSSQEMPPPEKPPAGRAEAGVLAGEGDASTATHLDMTPKSTVRAGTGGSEPQGHGSPDTGYASKDIPERDQASIDLYRKHFSGYLEPKAHLSSSPFIESDDRLKSERRHDISSDVSDGTNSYERRASSSHGMNHRVTPGLASPNVEQPPAGGREEGHQQETRGDLEGSWTERVRALQAYAEARGATLSTVSPTRLEYDALGPDTPRQYRRGSGDENEIMEREATLALYSYPPVESGREFFAQVPEARKQQLEKVKKELKDMEEQLKNMTKERINDVSETLGTGPSGSGTLPSPRRG